MNEASVRLPRGRHRLTRDEVVGSQRGRMLLAMAEAMAEKGYVSTSVADVISRAGVSRQTFYAQFSSKQDCFVNVLDTAATVILTTLDDAMADSGPPVERIGPLLAAYLETIANNSAIARVCMLEVYAAGPDALRRRAAVLERFTDLIASVLLAESARERFACEAFVAAVSNMVTARLAVGDLGGVVALRGPFEDLAGRLITSAVRVD
ncbi:MAG: TetR/AcrR family transcriptional regulator [Jatrophihabitans sp.]